MGSKLVKLLKWGVVLLAVSITTLLAVRAETGARFSLELWHTYVPHELTATEISKADWAAYLAAENTIFDEVRAEVTQTHRFALQSAPPRPALPARRLCLGRHQAAWSWHRAERPDRRRMGAMGRSDAPGGQRSAAAGRVISALASDDWVLQRWSARDEVRARRHE